MTNPLAYFTSRAERAKAPPKARAPSRATALALLALLASLGVAAGNFSHPYAVYEGYYSDHFSHMGSTLLFLAKGLDIYRKPVRENLTRSTQPKDLEFARENSLGTKELFVNPLDPRRPPLAINWSFQIRPYPPGVYLLFLPVATLFHFEKISFVAANRVIILSLLAVAFVNALLLFRFAFQAGDRWGLWLRLFSAAFACYWIECWALRGFYDVVAILFLFLCLNSLHRKNWLDCLFFYCCAVFTHYRALYYAPVVAVAVFLAWREARSKGKGFVAEWAGKWAKAPKFWLAMAMAGVAGACFLIALPQLETFAAHNPLYRIYAYAGWEGLSWISVVALGLMGLTLGLMAADRDWVAALILACYGMFLLRTPQAYPWHSLFLAPLLMFCSRRSGSWLGRAQWAGTLALTCWLGYFVYGIH